MSEQDTQVAETTSSDEEVVLEEETTNVDEEDVEALKAQLEKEKTAKAQILARAKKAEELLKESKSKPQPLQEKTALSKEDVEVMLLKTQGLDDKRIEHLKIISKGKGISILEAKSDEMFLAYEDKLQQQEKEQKASLGVAKGSPKKAVQKTTNLTKDEHLELWKKATGLN